MIYDLKLSIKNLIDFCELEDYKGWDPYDGLNSKIFKNTPFVKWDIARLIWIQLFKRSPFNLRYILKVPKEYNAKGIGLFLNGYCNLYKLSANGGHEFGSSSHIESKIRYLAEILINIQSRGYSGACWGYNFDWQARRLFFFPANTPTVVATSFCATALFNAYEVTKEKRYLETALSSTNFILKDLNRTIDADGYILSYSPLHGNDTVFNASLLGAKLLSYAYKYSGDLIYKKEAKKIVSAACAHQSDDGSWVYGLLPIQDWIDSFHTGYNLDSIYWYQKFCEDNSFKENLDKGMNYYLNNFFEIDGTPKYYNDKVYPIDIHCPGQLLVTLCNQDLINSYSEIVNKVTVWTINNMQDKKGYFYYQLKSGISSKISYMRWSNAFMFNALTHYILYLKNDKQIT
jgi:rhamnogalacturonyl hydrolase YesR